MSNNQQVALFCWGICVFIFVMISTMDALFTLMDGKRPSGWTIPGAAVGVIGLGVLIAKFMIMVPVEALFK